jgi:hypothetical protein
VRFDARCPSSVVDWGKAERSGPPEADKSAKASRQGVIAPLIVESEAWPLGGVLVESPAGLSLSRGR